MEVFCFRLPFPISTCPLSLYLDFLQKKTIGGKEETGFTEGSLTNPIVPKQLAQVPMDCIYVAILAQDQTGYHAKYATESQKNI